MNGTEWVCFPCIIITICVDIRTCTVSEHYKMLWSIRDSLFVVAPCFLLYVENFRGTCSPDRDEVIVKCVGVLCALSAKVCKPMCCPYLVSWFVILRKNWEALFCKSAAGVEGTARRYVRRYWHSTVSGFYSEKGNILLCSDVRNKWLKFVWLVYMYVLHILYNL